MDRITELAELSVGRGCGFALIAVVTLMVGMSSQMAVALSVGGVSTLMGSLILIVMAWRADHANHKRTELWVMLDPTERPAEAAAGRIVNGALKRAYYWFARQGALLAAGMLSCSLILRAVG